MSLLILVKQSSPRFAAYDGVNQKFMGAPMLLRYSHSHFQLRSSLEKAFTLSVVGPELSLGEYHGMGGGETDESFKHPRSRGTVRLFLHKVNGKNSQKLNLAVITGNLGMGLHQSGNQSYEQKQLRAISS